MICGYLIKIEGKVFGFVENPTPELFQRLFGMANFPDNQTIEELIDAEHYTSPLGLIFTCDKVRIIK